MNGIDRVVASAPGKVLITGGYLILERPNAGIVLSTNARFFAIVKPLYDQIKPDSWAWGWTDVKVTSPQLSRESFYKLSLKNATLQPVSSRESSNPFVEQAVQYAAATAHAVGKLFPLEEVVDILKGRWDHERTKFSLPPLMTLVLGEPGVGGSSTPSMVGAVKKWQKSDPQKSQDTWNKLSDSNSALETHFNMLSRLAEEHWDTYKCVINICSTLKADKWMEKATEPAQEAIVKTLLLTRKTMLEIRYLMRLMGEASGVPIEPESQTKILDETMNVEGVLLAGVPGAGGFDAVFAITLGDSVSNISKTWPSLIVLPLLVREDPRGVSLESGDPRTVEITSSISLVHID
ncbi:hypothetical protein ACFE04_013449 [Oxalis oulophora]